MRDLQKRVKQLPVLFFNGSSYDLPLIIKYLIPLLQNDDERVDLGVIKRNSSYLLLASEKFRFLDVRNYLAPGYSLDKFMRAYNATIEKSPFPYNFLDSYEKLSYPGLPPKAEFYSAIKAKGISDAEYARAQLIFLERGCVTFGDYLRIYNETDVVPFLEASVRMSETYWNLFAIDMFDEAIALPGVSNKYMYRSIKEKFALFREDDSDVYDLMKASLQGGLTMVQNRYAEVGHSCIRNNPHHPVKAVIGYDMNSMYLKAVGGRLPVGQHIVWDLNNDRFHKRKQMPAANVWLEYMQTITAEKIEYGIFNKGEPQVGDLQLRVDGVCHETKTVYQFHGCYYHLHFGCTNRKFLKNDQLTIEGLTVIQSQIRTDCTTAQLEDYGYRVVEMYACEFNNLINSDNFVKNSVKNIRLHFHFQPSVSKDVMLQAIKDDKVYGFARVSMHCPDGLKEHFDQMPPFTKKCLISRTDIGDHMQQYAEQHDLMKKPKLSLVNTYFIENELLITDSILWYLKHGMILTNLNMVIQYRPSNCFKPFTDLIINKRMDGDRDPNTAIIAETAKLAGNVSYGKSITNLDKHTSVKFVDAVQAREDINSKLFKKSTPFNNGFYEIESFKNKIVYNLPLHIGLTVYQVSKVSLLMWYYDFVLKFVPRSCIQWHCTDTDSAYVSLSGKTLRDVVVPDLLPEFDRIQHNWMVDPACPISKRRPGLMKVEKQGSGIYSLAPKTYICFEHDDQGNPQNSKMSTKGVSKVTNNFLVQHFRNVLFDQKSHSGINISIRSVPTLGIRTYIQERSALQYLYYKRKVLPNGIDTVPLDL